MCAPSRSRTRRSAPVSRPAAAAMRPRNYLNATRARAAWRPRHRKASAGSGCPARHPPDPATSAPLKTLRALSRAERTVSIGSGSSARSLPDPRPAAASAKRTRLAPELAGLLPQLEVALSLRGALGRLRLAAKLWERSFVAASSFLASSVTLAWSHGASSADALAARASRERTTTAERMAGFTDSPRGRIHSGCAGFRPNTRSRARVSTIRWAEGPLQHESGPLRSRPSRARAGRRASPSPAPALRAGGDSRDVLRSGRSGRVRAPASFVSQSMSSLLFRKSLRLANTRSFGLSRSPARRSRAGRSPRSSRPPTRSFR